MDKIGTQLRGKTIVMGMFNLGIIALSTCMALGATAPRAPGKMVDLGGHRLHVNCTGEGEPTVVVENGLGDFSFDWILVQDKVSSFARICTYDRAGYAWSDPGPKPRTFSQINLELRDALAKLGERGPFLLVGHSFGGPVARNFAVEYSKDVAGIVFVDAAYEGMRVEIGGNKTLRLGEDAKGASIPKPRETMNDSDKASASGQSSPGQQQTLEPMYKVLPTELQEAQLWAQSLPEINDAEDSQKQWSGEYFAKMLATPQAGKLGSIPVVVLTRANGGYADNLDVTAQQLEKERKDGQARLAQLSTNSKEIFISSGHNMELEAPGQVVFAIRMVVDAIRNHRRI